jgi:hypothetical protein
MCKGANMRATLRNFLQKLNAEIFPDYESKFSSTPARLEVISVDAEINLQMILDKEGNASLCVILKDDEVVDHLSVHHIKLHLGSPPPAYPPVLSPSLPSPAMLPGDATTDAPLPKPTAKRSKVKQ